MFSKPNEKNKQFEYGKNILNMDRKNFEYGKTF